MWKSTLDVKGNSFPTYWSKFLDRHNSTLSAYKNGTILFRESSCETHVKQFMVTRPELNYHLSDQLEECC